MTLPVSPPPTGKGKGCLKFLIVVIALVVGFGLAWRLFTRIRALPVEGVVRNAVTKEPVPDVVVRCFWAGRKYLPFDGGIGTFRSYSTVTDKEGRYRIPRMKIWLWPHQEVYDVSFDAYHPLYVREFWNWIWGYDPDEEHKYTTVVTSYAQNGVIHYDIELTHVRDRFKGPKDANDYRAFISTPGRLEAVVIKKKTCCPSYDLEEVIKTYEELAKITRILPGRDSLDRQDMEEFYRQVKEARGIQQ